MTWPSPWPCALAATGALLVGAAGCRAPAVSPSDARPAGSERWGTQALVAPNAPRPRPSGAPTGPGAGGPGTAAEAPAEPAELPAEAAPAPGAEPAEGDAAQTGAETPSAPVDGAAGEPAAAPAKKEPAITGSLSTVYFGRFTEGESDHDVHGVLSIDAGDPESDRWSAHATARLAADLDGGADGPDPFFELDDAHDGSVDERLYDAWVQYRGEGEVERMRFGRQTLWDTPAIAWFDGLLAATRELGSKRVEVGGYAGLPVHQHEASSPSGDLIAGLYATAHPWARGRARIDWMHLEDETSLFEADDDLLGLSLWQDVGAGVQLDGRYTRVGSDDRDLRLAATWSKPEDDLVVQLSWFRLLETQVYRALEIDPFSPTLMELEPYDQGRLMISKQIDRHLGVQTGFDLRRVTDTSDVGEFNRDYDRGFLTATVDETLPAELSLSLTGEVWDSDDNDIQTWGGDLSREFDAYVASIGSYYQLYKIDLYDADEREDVRTYFVRLRRRAQGGAFSWDVSYEYEDTDLDPFHTLRVGATWFF